MIIASAHSLSIVRPLCSPVVRGPYFSFCLKNREVKYRGSRTFPSFPAPQLWSRLPLINPLKLTQIFKPQTQQQSIFTAIQPNPDVVPSRCCLSQLPSTQSISTAKCASHVCATMLVAYIRLLNALALLSVAVLSRLFVLPPFLGNCCTAAISRGDTVFVIIQILFSPLFFSSLSIYL